MLTVSTQTPAMALLHGTAKVVSWCTHEDTLERPDYHGTAAAGSTNSDDNATLCFVAVYHVPVQVHPGRRTAARFHEPRPSAYRRLERNRHSRTSHSTEIRGQHFLRAIYRHLAAGDCKRGREQGYRRERAIDSAQPPPEIPGSRLRGASCDIVRRILVSRLGKESGIGPCEA